MTEISLIVTLNNQFNSTQPKSTTPTCNTWSTQTQIYWIYFKLWRYDTFKFQMFCFGFIGVLRSDVQLSLVYFTAEIMWNTSSKILQINIIVMKTCDKDVRNKHNIWEKKEEIWLSPVTKAPTPPWRRQGFKSRTRPPYPQRVVKGD